MTEIHDKDKRENMAIERDFLHHIIMPTLKHLSQHIPYSEDTARLLLGTAIHESGDFLYLRQIRGPAVGVFQVEPFTLDDVYNNYLEYRTDLKMAVESLRQGVPRTSALALNHSYATAIARLVYRRSPLPIGQTAEDFWRIYKPAYNSRLGKAKRKQALPAFEKALRV